MGYLSRFGRCSNGLWIIGSPKGGGVYRGIGLLVPIWKLLERIMDHWLDAIKLHDCLHGCRANRGTGTAVIKAKMVQQLSYLELKPFYGVFLNLKKAFNLMDQDLCIMILEGHGAGPWMIRLIQTYWHDAIMVCRASGNYGMPFKAGRGMTQGSPLSAKLFNILVNAVARKWLRELREGGGYKVWELDNLISTFFAIFYVNDAYLALRGVIFLQCTLDSLVSLFERVGLKTNTFKMQTMKGVQYFTGQKSFKPATRTSRIEVHKTFTKRDLIILAPIYLPENNIHYSLSFRR